MMRHPLITVAAIAVAAAGTIGGIAIAAGGSSSQYGSGSSMQSAGSAAVPVTPVRTWTVQTATASVQGKSETILVDAKGLPLYTYKGDTPTTSNVTGQLAALWPPLVAKTPNARGVMGALTTVATSNGQQVAYNGHFLYTFVQDSAGHVTGQGVQNFFVATPALGATTSDTAAVSPPQSSNGYGY
jgi:predicted lipoprotein with Yx(FWY)xxD motif